MLLPPTICFALTYSSHYKACSQLLGSTAVGIVGMALCFFNYGSNVAVVMFIFPAVIMALLYSFFFVGLFFPAADCCGHSRRLDVVRRASIKE
jgi:hypothetical protein